MEFRILGPLEVEDDGRRIELGGARQRALLAILLVWRTEVVPRERLLEELYGAEQPVTAVKTLQAHVSRLRKALGGSNLRTQGGGYGLETGPDDVDADRFARLVAAGRSELVSGDAAAAARSLGEALALWRGPALSDFSYEDFAQGEIARLEELRLGCVEEFCEARLALGRHAETIGELERLVAEHPARERLRGQLMLALYRSGRQAESLQAYRDGRRALVDGLGIEPGRELRELEVRILTQDPSLEPPRSEDTRDARPALGSLPGANLPTPATSFLGREAELAEVVDLLTREDVRLLTLTGPGGTGKTRLALQAAAATARSFPDGVFWVSLASLRDPRLVLEAATTAFGCRDELAEQIGDKTLLLLFDNFEHVVEAAGDVAGLLAACPNLHVLVTSRELLTIPGEYAYRVPALQPQEGTELFLARARAVNPGVQLDDTVPQICRRLDNLPLALELAAARARALTSEELLERLSESLDLLKAGRAVEPRQRTLRTTIEWSHDLLDEDEQRLFARLAVFRGGCTVAAAERICDADLDTLQALLDKSLVDHTEGRYWMLETIHEYAAERLDASPMADELRVRHWSYYLELAEAANPHLRSADIRGLDSTSTAWLDLLEPEHDNFRAAFERLQVAGQTQHALRLAAALTEFSFERGHVAEGQRRLEEALAADASPTAARANALLDAADIGGIHYTVAEGTASSASPVDRAEEASAIYRMLGDLAGIANAEVHIAQALFEEGDRTAAMQRMEQAVPLLRELDDPHAALEATRDMGWLYGELGEWDRAVSLLEEVLERARELDNGRQETMALGALAVIAIRDNRAADALSLVHGYVRGIGDLDPGRLTVAFFRIGYILARTGRPAAAVRMLAASEALSEELGARPTWLAGDAEETCVRLRAELGEAAFAEAWDEGLLLTVDEAVAFAVAEADA